MIVDDWACSPVGDRQILTGSDLSGTFKRPGGYTLRITRNGAESGAVSRTPEYATITRAWTGRLMTVRAYQLVDTAPGSDVSALIDALRAIDGTKTVDAVTGPALRFRPRKVISAPGDTFSVDLIAEEVADLMLAHVTIEYDDGAPTNNNPLGVKGAGEAGCVGSLPAVVNAVLGALKESDIVHIAMPLTPQKVWQAIRDNGAFDPRGLMEDVL